MTKQYKLDGLNGLIIEGDVLDGLEPLEDASIEAIVTDPPYELKFMGKDWDRTGVSFQPETWEACLRVLKPGGHMIVFGSTRTHHRMWVAIEDVGFEVREMLLWLYGQGFPKSLSIGKAIDKAAGAEREIVGFDPRSKGIKPGSSNYGGGGAEYEAGHDITAPATDAAKQWDGWGTALKPACEPILLARKPLAEKTVAANVLKWGTGALNIDATRLAYLGEEDKASATPQGRVTSKESESIGAKPDAGRGLERIEFARPEQKGRWPANVVLDEEAGALLDEQTGVLKSGRMKPGQQRQKTKGGGGYHGNMPDEATAAGTYGDSGGPSRFFYVAKASRTERDRGLGSAATVSGAEAVGRKPNTAGLNSPRAGAGRTASQVRNFHPTVKPIALMRWLVRMVTPPDGVVLDPFCGSGSTLIAATEEGFGFVGIEISPEYCKITLQRLLGTKR